MANSSKKRSTWKVSASSTNCEMHVVWCLDIPDHSQSQLTLNILKQMECQNRKVSSNDKQKTNGNDHQLTFAGRNVFLSTAIRISPSLSNNESLVSEFLHPYQAMRDSSLAILQPPVVFNIIEDLHSASQDDVPEPKKDQIFSCHLFKSHAEKCDVFSNHKNTWSENSLNMTKLK